MAKCKSCGAGIADDRDYCKNCESKKKADESYLDSLLSSVMDKEPVRVVRDSRQLTMTTKEKSAANSQTNKQDLLKNNDLPLNRDLTKNNYDKKSTIKEDSKSSEYDILDDTDDSYLNELFKEDLDNFDLSEDDVESESMPKADLYDSELISSAEGEPYRASMQMEASTDLEADIIMDDSQQAIDFIDSFENDTKKKYEQQDSDDISSMLGDLFHQMDSKDIQEMNETKEAPKLMDIFEEQDIPEIEEIQKMYDDQDQPENMETPDDISQILDFISEQEPVQEPVPELEPILELEPELELEPMQVPDFEDTISFTNQVNDEPEGMTAPSTLAANKEALDAFGEDDDIMQFWNSINMDVDTMNEPDDHTLDNENMIKASTKSKVIDLANGENFESMMPDIPEDVVDKAKLSKVKGKKKKSLLQLLFGNIKTEKSPEEIEKLKEAALKKLDDEENAAISKKESLIASKEDSKKLKAEKAKQAAEDKAASTKKKQEDKVVKTEKKKEIKDKKEIARQQLLAEIEHDEGRINKFGAAFVFSLFAVILIVVVVGTNVYTYRIAMKNADTNFTLNRYNEAYQDVYGLEDDIQEEEYDLYDKIMTVMYVNKQLNSYYNYQAGGSEVDALDSLLKGLMRYNKYIYYGTNLGIKDDLDSVKEKLLEELQNTYHLSEDQANELLNCDTQEEYSTMVYDVVANLN